MQLKKLYDLQRKLDSKIDYQGEDKLDYLIMALRVEIGEMNNEWRVFKFWSKDRISRREIIGTCQYCNTRGFDEDEEGYKSLCGMCKGTGKVVIKNPLLEEYVDGLHFVLNIGIYLNITNANPIFYVPSIDNWSIPKQVEAIHDTIGKVRSYKTSVGTYHQLVHLYLGLGKMLEFSEEDIEQAYLDKNEENHDRQRRGY